LRIAGGIAAGLPAYAVQRAARAVLAAVP
jgi:hypothetical protein